MKLKVLLPTRVMLEREVEKITAEAQNGSFTLLPRHVDFLAALAPGLLSFVGVNQQEEFLAVDGGVLVKAGDEVLVSTRNAVSGPSLGTLKETVEEQFKALDEKEKQARGVLARFQAEFVRRFLEIQ